VTGSLQRPLRLGMVGGGEGAYTGNIHRIACRLDGAFQLMAGAFDVDPKRGQAFAATQGIDSQRAPGDYKAMIEGERGRADRIDAVAICTPNHTHFPIAKAFLEAGFDVICEKPLTTALEDAIALERTVKETGRFMWVTYTYSGYPMIHQARAMIAAGELGRIRVVQAEYPLDWMATAIETEGNAQAAWRTDPKKSGRGGSIGDIGTHAYHLASFVTGLKVEALSADLARFVEGRLLDDNAHVLIRYEGGARGLLWSSQIALGNSNGVRVRVFGEIGSIKPENMHPTIDNKAGRAVADYLKELMPYSPPGILDMAWDERTRVFAQGGCAMTYVWSGNSSAWEGDPNAPAHGHVAYVPHPAGLGAPNRSTLGGCASARIPPL
jgi:predicted dehydrogenase